MVLSEPIAAVCPLRVAVQPLSEIPQPNGRTNWIPTISGTYVVAEHWGNVSLLPLDELRRRSTE